MIDLDDFQDKLALELDLHARLQSGVVTGHFVGGRVQHLNGGLLGKSSDQQLRQPQPVQTDRVRGWLVFAGDVLDHPPFALDGFRQIAQIFLGGGPGVIASPAHGVRLSVVVDARLQQASDISGGAPDRSARRGATVTTLNS